MITPQQLTREARALLGTPWRHKGRTRLGVDCIGLVLLAAKNGGLDIISYANVKAPNSYSRNASPMLYDLVKQTCTHIPQPVPGCVLFFRFDTDMHARHFGLFTESNTVIHADAKTRRQVVEHGYRAHWKRWTDSAWLLPGVTYE